MEKKRTGTKYEGRHDKETCQDPPAMPDGIEEGIGFLVKSKKKQSPTYDHRNRDALQYCQNVIHQIEVEKIYLSQFDKVFCRFL